MKYQSSRLTPFPPTFPLKSSCKRIHDAKIPLRRHALLARALFSASYESLPIPDRFRSPLFSNTYKSLFAQPLYFHIYTKPPGVAPLAFNFRLSTARRRDLLNPRRSSAERNLALR